MPTLEEESPSKIPPSSESASSSSMDIFTVESKNGQTTVPNLDYNDDNVVNVALNSEYTLSMSTDGDDEFDDGSCVIISSYDHDTIEKIKKSKSNDAPHPARSLILERYKLPFFEVSMFDSPTANRLDFLFKHVTSVPVSSIPYILDLLGIPISSYSALKKVLDIVPSQYQTLSTLSYKHDEDQNLPICTHISVPSLSKDGIGAVIKKIYENNYKVAFKTSINGPDHIMSLPFFLSYSTKFRLLSAFTCFGVLNRHKGRYTMRQAVLPLAFGSLLPAELLADETIRKGVVALSAALPAFGGNDRVYRIIHNASTNSFNGVTLLELYPSSLASLDGVSDGEITYEVVIHFLSTFLFSLRRFVSQFNAIGQNGVLVTPEGEVMGVINPQDSSSKKGGLWFDPVAIYGLSLILCFASGIPSVPLVPPENIISTDSSSAPRDPTSNATSSGRNSITSAMGNLISRRVSRSISRGPTSSQSDRQGEQKSLLGATNEGLLRVKKYKPTLMELLPFIPFQFRSSFLALHAATTPEAMLAVRALGQPFSSHLTGESKKSAVGLKKANNILEILEDPIGPVVSGLSSIGGLLPAVGSKDLDRISVEYKTWLRNHLSPKFSENSGSPEISKSGSGSKPPKLKEADVEKLKKKLDEEKSKNAATANSLNQEKQKEGTSGASRGRRSESREDGKKSRFPSLSAARAIGYFKRSGSSTREASKEGSQLAATDNVSTSEKKKTENDSKENEDTSADQLEQVEKEVDSKTPKMESTEGEKQGVEDTKSAEPKSEIETAPFVSDASSASDLPPSTTKSGVSEDLSSADKENITPESTIDQKSVPVLVPSIAPLSTCINAKNTPYLRTAKGGIPAPKLPSSGIAATLAPPFRLRPLGDPSDHSYIQMEQSVWSGIVEHIAVSFLPLPDVLLNSESGAGASDARKTLSVFRSRVAKRLIRLALVSVDPSNEANSSKSSESSGNSILTPLSSQLSQDPLLMDTRSVASSKDIQLESNVITYNCVSADPSTSDGRWELSDPKSLRGTTDWNDLRLAMQCSKDIDTDSNEKAKTSSKNSRTSRKMCIMVLCDVEMDVNEDNVKNEPPSSTPNVKEKITHGTAFTSLNDPLRFLGKTMTIAWSLVPIDSLLSKSLKPNGQHSTVTVKIPLLGGSPGSPAPLPPHLLSERFSKLQKLIPSGMRRARSRSRSLNPQKQVIRVISSGKKFSTEKEAIPLDVEVENVSMTTDLRAPVTTGLDFSQHPVLKLKFSPLETVESEIKHIVPYLPRGILTTVSSIPLVISLRQLLLERAMALETERSRAVISGGILPSPSSGLAPEAISSRVNVPLSLLSITEAMRTCDSEPIQGGLLSALSGYFNEEIKKHNDTRSVPLGPGDLDSTIIEATLSTMALPCLSVLARCPPSPTHYDANIGVESSEGIILEKVRSLHLAVQQRDLQSNERMRSLAVRSHLERVEGKELIWSRVQFAKPNGSWVAVDAQPLSDISLCCSMYNPKLCPCMIEEVMLSNCILLCMVAIVSSQTNAARTTQTPHHVVTDATGFCPPHSYGPIITNEIASLLHSGATALSHSVQAAANARARVWQAKVEYLSSGCLRNDDSYKCRQMRHYYGFDNTEHEAPVDPKECPIIYHNYRLEAHHTGLMLKAVLHDMEGLIQTGGLVYYRPMYYIKGHYSWYENMGRLDSWKGVSYMSYCLSKTNSILGAIGEIIRKLYHKIKYSALIRTKIDSVFRSLEECESQNQVTFTPASSYAASRERTWFGNRTTIYEFYSTSSPAVYHEWNWDFVAFAQAPNVNPFRNHMNNKYIAPVDLASASRTPTITHLSGASRSIENTESIEFGTQGDSTASEQRILAVLPNDLDDEDTAMDRFLTQSKNNIINHNNHAPHTHFHTSDASMHRKTFGADWDLPWQLATGAYPIEQCIPISEQLAWLQYELLNLDTKITASLAAIENLYFTLRDMCEHCFSDTFPTNGRINSQLRLLTV